MDMTKFDRSDDPDFISITGEIDRWVKESGTIPKDKAASLELGATENPDNVDWTFPFVPKEKLNKRLLSAAVSDNRTRELRNLLRAGADIEARREDKSTALVFSRGWKQRSYQDSI